MNVALLGAARNNPATPPKAVLNIVRGEQLAAGKPFPSSIALGSDCHATIKKRAEGVLQRLED